MLISSGSASRIKWRGQVEEAQTVAAQEHNEIMATVLLCARFVRAGHALRCIDIGKRVLCDCFTRSQCRLPFAID